MCLPLVKYSDVYFRVAVRPLLFFCVCRVAAERHVVGASGEADGQCGIQHRLRVHVWAVPDGGQVTQRQPTFVTLGGHVVFTANVPKVNSNVLCGFSGMPVWEFVPCRAEWEEFLLRSCRPWWDWELCHTCLLQALKNSEDGVKILQSELWVCFKILRKHLDFWNLPGKPNNLHFNFSNHEADSRFFFPLDFDKLIFFFQKLLFQDHNFWKSLTFLRT